MLVLSGAALALGIEHLVGASVAAASAQPVAPNWAYFWGQFPIGNDPGCASSNFVPDPSDPRVYHSTGWKIVAIAGIVPGTDCDHVLLELPGTAAQHIR